MPEAVTSPGGQGPAEQSAHRHSSGAQGDAFEDIRAPHEATIDDDLSPTGDGLDNGGQHIQGGRAVVQLSAPVVGDVHHIHSVLHGQEGILRCQYAFEHQGELSFGAEPCDLFPGEAGLIVPVLSGGTHEIRVVRRHGPGVAVLPIPVPEGGERRIDGYADGTVARRFDPSHQGLQPGAIAPHVDLVEHRPGGLGHHLLQAGGVEAAHEADGTHLTCYTGDVQRAIRVVLSNGADGSQEHGKLQGVAQKLGLQAPLADIP